MFLSEIQCLKQIKISALLAMIALSAVQSSTHTFIHNTILFIDTSDNVSYNKRHRLIGTPYLSIIASNEFVYFKYEFNCEDFC